MHRQQTTRPITASQVLSVMAVAVALYCMVAFGTKSLEAYRLTKWRSELQLEVDGLERRALILRQEIDRRHSPEWYDQVLREAGYVPQDAVRVIVTETGEDNIAVAASEQSLAAGTAEPTVMAETSPSRDMPLQLFHNPNWEAWKAFLLRFDE